MKILLNNNVTDIRFDEDYTFKSIDSIEFFSGNQGGVWYKKQFYNNILKSTNDDDASREDIVLVNNCFLVSAELLFKQLGYLEHEVSIKRRLYQSIEKIKFDLIRLKQR